MASAASAATLRRFLLGPCLLLLACTRSDERFYGTTEPKHGPDVIWTNLGTEPEWIDPGKCSDQSGGVVILNTFAGLTQLHPKTLRPMPDIAERWQVSEDGRVYTFELRSTTWSDGRPLTAHDFVWSWRRVLDRKTASKYASFLYPIRHAEAFHRLAVLVTGLSDPAAANRLQELAKKHAPVERVEPAPDLGGMLVYVGGAEADKASARAQLVKGLSATRVAGGRLSARTVDASVVGVRALDDLTLEVKLQDPLPYFLDIVAFYTAIPVPRHVIERLQGEGRSPDLWTRPGNLVSNGPYRLVEWKFRQYMLFEKNPLYWDADNVKTPRIRMLMVENSNTVLNMYEAGELDYIGNASLPSEFVDHLKRFEDFRSGPYLGTYFYWVNTKRKPLDDLRVRQALKLAIDRKSLVDNVTRGGQIPTADIVPDDVGGYQGLGSPLFDPERARALLAEAGFPKGQGLPTITLTYNTNEGHKQLAEALQQMWKSNLGVEVEIENQEWKVYLKSLQSMDFQVARMGWIGDYADPYTFLELLTGGNGNNHSNWNDAEYDQMIRQANTTTDPKARLALLRRAEARAMEHTPVIPLYVYTRLELIKPYLKGNPMNYQHRQMFKHWWVDPSAYGGAAP